MDDGALILVLLAALGGLLIMVLGLLAFSRLGDSHGGRPVPAAYRAAGPDQRWCRGLLRMRDDQLLLRGPGGLSEGPWLRGNLDLGVASRVPPDEADALGRRGLIRVPVTYGTSSFELALGEQHYTALRAWVEAVPPGWNTRVA